MNTGDRQRNKKEEKTRRKKLLRAFREEELTKAWNGILDEVGPCGADDLERDSDPFDCLDPVPDSDLYEADEDYPNKLETMHNIFECD